MNIAVAIHFLVPPVTNLFTSQAGGSSALLMDLAANEKSVHGDFFNGERIENFAFVPGHRLAFLSSDPVFHGPRGGRELVLTFQTVKCSRRVCKTAFSFRF